jgi:hypothetical protein
MFIQMQIRNQLQSADGIYNCSAGFRIQRKSYKMRKKEVIKGQKCCKEENWQDKSKKVRFYIDRFYNPLQFQVGMLLCVSGLEKFYKHQPEYAQKEEEVMVLSVKIAVALESGHSLPLSAGSIQITQRILKYSLWEKK